MKTIIVGLVLCATVAFAAPKHKKPTNQQLWNALRTRVVTDVEMVRILEVGYAIVPAKDGGYVDPCGLGGGGICYDDPAQDVAEQKNAEVIFQNALLNQFKMRVLDEDRPISCTTLLNGTIVPAGK